MCAAVLAGGTASNAAPPGAAISNQATLEYLNAANQPEVVSSNAVALTAAVLRSPATLQFTRIAPAAAGSWQETVGPSACLQGGNWVTQADPVLVGGAVIDPGSVQELVTASAYNLGETVFLRLADADQNLDFQALDTAEVTIRHPLSADSESLRLVETGPDSGVFAGYLATAARTGRER